MRALDAIRTICRTICGKIAGRLATSRRVSDFTCGECERNQKCGLPPHDDCVYRLMQIAARDGAPRRRWTTVAYYRAMRPR